MGVASESIITLRLMDRVVVSGLKSIVRGTSPSCRNRGFYSGVVAGLFCNFVHQSCVIGRWRHQVASSSVRAYEAPSGGRYWSCALLILCLDRNVHGYTNDKSLKFLCMPAANKSVVPLYMKR